MRKTALCLLLASLFFASSGEGQEVVFYPSHDWVAEGGANQWYATLNGDSIPATFNDFYNAADAVELEVEDVCVPGSPCTPYVYARFRFRDDVTWRSVAVSSPPGPSVPVPGDTVFVPGDTIFVPTPVEVVVVDTVYLPAPEPIDPDVQGFNVSCTGTACTIAWTLRADAVGYVVWQLRSDPITLLGEAVAELGTPEIEALLYAAPMDPDFTWTASDINGDRGTIYGKRIDVGECAFPIVPDGDPGESFSCVVTGIQPGIPYVFSVLALEAVPEPGTEVEAGTPPPPPNDPSGVSATRAGADVTFSWSPTVGATGYALAWGPHNGSNTQNAETVEPSLTVTTTLAGFVCVRAVARNASGTSYSPDPVGACVGYPGEA